MLGGKAESLLVLGSKITSQNISYMKTYLPFIACLLLSSIILGQTADFPQNALGVNPILLPFDLDQKAASVEYERWVGGKTAIGVRGIYYHEDSFEGFSKYDETSFAIGFIHKTYLMSKGTGMRGFYVGSALDLLSFDWTERTERYKWSIASSSYEYVTYDYEGSGLSLYLSGQLGYKFLFGEMLYLEPAFSGGVSLWSQDDEEEGLTVLFMPALTVGARF